MSILFDLFIIFLKIGSFSIGGGYAIVPLIQKEIVDNQSWLSLQEFTDILTISQMTPGPLSINASTFVGIRLGGTLGAIVATFACVITGIIISITLFKFFKKNSDISEISNILKGLRSTSIGLIIAASCTIILISFTGQSSIIFDLKTINLMAAAIFAVSMFLLRKFKISTLNIILLSGLIGLFLYT
ncbi:chromate transporter [Clostridium sartagoforme]|uniref:Chromate transporter n=1 Tax=Clostridium sartagoforme TaxID=84031 RepID=A0A4S2DMU6_9CLOT|nr:MULTISPECIES: chromate transporter [Clostridium]MBS5937254.1 chromate transporter [Clostridium sp.]TGY43677.1 chromate transporter [Clostridium sartagoforme]